MVRLYELKTEFDKRSEKRKRLMSICGGLICNECTYTNFTALALSYKNTQMPYHKRLDYYINNPDEARKNVRVLCYNHLMWKRNINKRSKVLRSHNKSHNKQIEQILHILNQYECQNCGEFDKRFLEIDHIKGLGGRLVKQLPGRAREERRYHINNPKQCKEDLQILCSNCNQLKKEERMEYGLIHA